LRLKNLLGKRLKTVLFLSLQLLQNWSQLIVSLLLMTLNQQKN